MDELLALRMGLIIVKTNKIRHLVIKTDLAVIIHMLDNDRSLHHNVDTECRTLLVELEATPPTQI